MPCANHAGCNLRNYSSQDLISEASRHSTSRMYLLGLFPAPWLRGFCVAAVCTFWHIGRICSWHVCAWCIGPWCLSLRSARILCHLRLILGEIHTKLLQWYQLLLTQLQVLWHYSDHACICLLLTLYSPITTTLPLTALQNSRHHTMSNLIFPYHRISLIWKVLNYRKYSLPVAWQHMIELSETKMVTQLFDESA